MCTIECAAHVSWSIMPQASVAESIGTAAQPSRSLPVCFLQAAIMCSWSSHIRRGVLICNGLTTQWFLDRST